MAHDEAVVRTITLSEAVGWTFGVLFGIMVGITFANGVMASILRGDFWILAASLGGAICYGVASALTTPPFYRGIEEHFHVKLSGPLRFVGVMCSVALALVFGYVVVMMSGVR